ncbi:hypothetical protein, partial [Okeania hirsuta]|uniref:hypothetical protein n=1 Tax=Okeania hirsuta TaxID=1458930 RepID=UPI001960FFCC
MSRVAFDAFGLVVATSLWGKQLGKQGKPKEVGDPMRKFETIWDYAKITDFIDQPSDIKVRDYLS